MPRAANGLVESKHALHFLGCGLKKKKGFRSAKTREVFGRSFRTVVSFTRASVKLKRQRNEVAEIFVVSAKI